MAEKIICSRYAGFFISAVILLFVSCGGNIQQKEMDTPTAGKIRIAVDDAYRLLLDTEIYTFQSLYKYATVDTMYRNEADVITAFLQDSVPLMVVNRKLTKMEEQNLNARQIIPKTTCVAYDAVAFIVNKNNPDSNLFYDQVSSILNGQITEWKQINPKSRLTDIKVVFDHYKSSNTRYFREKFNLEKLPGICFAVSDNNEVIKYVENNKNAIGVISVNWISDKRDTISNNFLSRVTVAGISAEGTDDPNTTFYQPYQAYIAQNFYPFRREVYFINRQTYTGLAYGFTSFVAGSQGQLIILHSGLVPATMPVRIVQIKR